MADALLSVRNLKTYFYTDEGVVRAVDGLSYDLQRGEVLGIVGESGSGKSVHALSVMRLIPTPPGKIVDGEIRFEGRNLLKLSDEEMRKIRGNRIAMIFQEPMTSLNPVLTIGEQIAEAIILHQHLDKKAAWDRAAEMHFMSAREPPDTPGHTGRTMRQIWRVATNRAPSSIWRGQSAGGP